MNHYRVYMLNEPEGRFVGFEEFEALDDVDAVRHCGQYAGERPLELWCGARKVRSIPAAAPHA